MAKRNVGHVVNIDFESPRRKPRHPQKYIRPTDIQQRDKHPQLPQTAQASPSSPHCLPPKKHFYSDKLSDGSHPSSTLQPSTSFYMKQMWCSYANLTRFLFQVDDCQAIAVLPRLLINKERSGFASPLEQAHFRYSH